METVKMNKVIIALDYNPTAQKVAEVGYSLAKTMNAEIILLHILSTPANYTSMVYDPIMGFGGFYDLDYYKSDTKLLIKSALEYLKQIKIHLGDSAIETMVKEGEYAETILETANLSRADIIVMGSHSKKWLEKILVGSTTEKILHDTNIPLLIVPTKNRFYQF
jgi:nucleotide-binding universal stress UspA family protein